MLQRAQDRQYSDINDRKADQSAYLRAYLGRFEPVFLEYDRIALEENWGIRTLRQGGDILDVEVTSYLKSDETDQHEQR